MGSSTWVLVANRSKAKIFAIAAGNKSLTLVEEIDYPEGRMHGSEFTTDRPGKTFDSAGDHRHAFSKTDNIDEQLENQFARVLSSYLDKKRSENLFRSLVVVADPGFLGELLKSLTPTTRRAVNETLDKNLVHLNAGDLAEYI
jgi:protein required for attachment to host cells